MQRAMWAALVVASAAGTDNMPFMDSDGEAMHGHADNENHSMPMPPAEHPATHAEGHSPFFTSAVDTLILFEGLETAGGGQYFAALLLVFVIAAATGVLRHYATVVSRGTLPLPVRGCLMAVVLTFMYALMLVTMTMNVGLYFSVIFGLTLAWVITEIWDQKRLNLNTIVAKNTEDVNL